MIWEKDSQNCAAQQEIFDLEGILVGIVSWFVIVQHEVNDIARRSKEDNLEDGIVQALGIVKRP